MSPLDIHNYGRQYATAERIVRESEISARNKELIFGYRDACLLHQVCGRVRLIRVFWTLRDFALRLGKDFDQATTDDLQRLIASLLDGSFKPSTVGTYKAILKRFMGFVLRPHEFPHLDQQPREIAWLHSHVRKRDQPRLQRCNLLLPAEVAALQRVCNNARDRALIAALWEAGPRISEVGNLQIKHVTKDKDGFLLDLSGKTGHRSVLVVSAAPHLSYWLSVHPFADNPEAPLWINDGYHPAPRQVKYATLRAMLKRLLEHAGITKRLYPHLFRHSRVTYMLAMGFMNEQQAKTYFGWTPDSDMLATYAHLCDQDANNAILRENNRGTAHQPTRAFQPTMCPTCNEANPPTARYCTKCTMTLHPDTAYQAAVRQEQITAVLLRVFQVMVKKGLLDEAADEIHNAGLGDALKALATSADSQRDQRP